MRACLITVSLLFLSGYDVAAFDEDFMMLLQLTQRAAPKPAKELNATMNPVIPDLIKEYSFRSVRNQRGETVNIILVRAHWENSPREWELYRKYKDELLFIGMSSLEDFPLSAPNPYSVHFPNDRYTGLFPGFLNMYHHPENIYPSNVTTLLMSQSDFSLPEAGEARPKKYDFVYSGSDQEINNNCVGWSMYCKNWTFAQKAIDVMCGDLNMTGVLAATKSKDGTKSCSIPERCQGKVLQTPYLDQGEFHNYVKESRFLFVPNVHDASPRVVTQSMALNTPVLMNKNIIGGWKYINEKTGEFFSDMSDLRDGVERILRNAADGSVYQPRQSVLEMAGDDVSGRRLFKFIDENFRDRVKLPEGTTHLYLVNA